MAAGNQFSLFLLQVAATVSLSIAAAEGVNYVMRTPYEPSTYAVTSTAKDHVGPAPVSETLQRGGMTPFVETTTVELDPTLIAALRKTPLRQVAVEPLGTSMFAFVMVLNGKTTSSLYSQIHGYESMYYLDITGATPRLWITERASKTWAVSTIAYVINKDIKHLTDAANHNASK